MTRPFAHVKELDTLGRYEPNVADKERVASVAAGLLVGGFGLWKRTGATPLFLLFGGLLMRRGISGQCPLYRKLGRARGGASWSGRGVRDQKGIRVEKTIEVQADANRVYHHWRRLENLPNFMPHLKSITETDDNISHWVVEGPAGSRVEWDAEMINDVPGKLIAWQTLPGAQVQSAGSVRFAPTNGGTGTLISVVFEYHPPAGALGAAVASLFREAPEQQLAADLARFKEFIEREA